MAVQCRGRQYHPVVSLSRGDAVVFAQSIFPGERLGRILRFDETVSAGALLSPTDSSVLSTFSLCEEGGSRITLYPLQ